MKTTDISLRTLSLQTLTALLAITPFVAGCVGSEEELVDEEADTTESAFDGALPVHFMAVHSNRAMDVASWSTDNGAKIQQWSYNKQGNQQWKLHQVATNTYTIISVHSNKCLDVSGWGTANGTKIQQWDCHGGTNQQFKLHSVGSGEYQVIGVDSGKCLDVTDVSTNDGAPLQIWSCGGGGNQRWKVLNDGSSQPTPTPSSGGKTEYAPYFETWVWGGSSTFASLKKLHDNAGLMGATLAFVLSNGGCATTRDIQDNMGDVNAFRSAGGHVKASFGGASGTYLEARCSTSDALAGAMRSFVDETNITDLDFDIEQGQVMNTGMNKFRAMGLKSLQQQRNVKVSFTLPVDPSGLPENALDVVRQAVYAGVTISHLNLMVMDYGISGSMSGYAKQSLNGTYNQLRNLMPSLSDAATWQMLGATPMIGQNDSQNEVFTLGDAQQLVAFAQQKNLGLVAFWAIQRDKPGSDYNEATTVNSSNFQFHNIFKGL